MTPSRWRNAQLSPRARVSASSMSTVSPTGTSSRESSSNVSLSKAYASGSSTRVEAGDSSGGCTARARDGPDRGVVSPNAKNVHGGRDRRGASRATGGVASTRARVEPRGRRRGTARRRRPRARRPSSRAHRSGARSTTADEEKKAEEVASFGRPDHDVLSVAQLVGTRVAALALELSAVLGRLELPGIIAHGTTHVMALRYILAGSTAAVGAYYAPAAYKLYELSPR